MTTAHPRIQCYTETLPRLPRAAGQARSLLARAVAAWDLPDAADPAATVLSELVTNAVVHGRGDRIRVIVDRPRVDRLYLGVVDRSPHALPVLRTPTPADPGGRGLVLVAALADRWGCDQLGGGTSSWVRPFPWGKRVWAELAAVGR
jgi:anti-sigma regulatory factor (Ser/Thr protein kinase)